MAEAHKINDGLYVVPLRDGKVQLRILIQEDEDKEEWRCKNLSMQDVYKLMTFLRNEVFISVLRRAPNKGSSFSTNLEREIYNFYNGDNSKIIFYGGIEL